MVNITSDSDNYLEALDSFKKSIQKHGPKKTIHILKSAQIKDDSAVVISRIVDAVLAEWRSHKIKRIDLFKKGNRGELICARDAVIYLISQTTTLNHKEVAERLSLGADTVRKTIKKHSELSIESKVDCKVIERNSRLLLKLIPFIKK